MNRLAVLLLWLLLGLPTSAQVVFDAKNSATAPCATSGVCNTTAATTLTFTHVMGSVSNGALVVAAMLAGTAVQPATFTATYNGVAMTQITGTATGATASCVCAGVMFGLLAPAAGSHSVVVSWTGSLEAHAISASFSGVNQTSVAVAFPHGTQIVQTTNVAGPSTGPVTSATNNIVVAYATEQSSAWGTISGTLIAKDDTTGPAETFAANYTAGAATVNPSFAFGSPSTWSFGATDILAASGGGGAVTASPLTTLGVGN